jgi:alanyl-tRNA synthetase
VLLFGDPVSVVMSSGVKDVDCSDIVKRVLSGNGGKGGGKQDFAQGGISGTSCKDTVLNSLIGSVKNALERKN